MSADQFLTVDGRPTVRVERRYPHPIDKVWRAVTTPEHLGQWFPSPVDIDLRPGGSMTFGGFGESGRGDRHHRSGRGPATAHVHVGRRPADLRAGVGRRRHDLRADPLVRRALRRAELRHRMGVVPRRASRLLAGDPLPPADRGIARHEELVHEFGLDQPEVTESDGGWTVRVERQLTCPAAVAWDLWFGKDQRHRRAAHGTRCRRAADAVHGTGRRDRHDDRGRSPPRPGVRRGADGWPRRAPSARTRRRHRSRREDHTHRHRHRSRRARCRRTDVGHRRHRASRSIGRRVGDGPASRRLIVGP